MLGNYSFEAQCWTVLVSSIPCNQKGQNVLSGIIRWPLGKQSLSRVSMAGGLHVWGATDTLLLLELWLSLSLVGAYGLMNLEVFPA